MDTRELSKLSYLAQALVGAPQAYKQLLAIAYCKPNDKILPKKLSETLQKALIPPSDDMRRVLEIWEKLFDEKGTKVSVKDAIALIKSDDPLVKRAGLSLEFAFCLKADKQMNSR